MTGNTEKSLRPTRKWWAAQATAVIGWLIAAITAEWVIGTELQILAVTIAGAAFTSWLLPNENTPGGVPRR